jgi:hypothetical protein
MLNESIILIVFSLVLVAAGGWAMYIGNTKNNYIPISILTLSLFVSLVVIGYTRTTSMFNNLAQYTKDQISNEEIKGFKVLGLNYKTSKVTVKLPSGGVKEYTLTHYPVDIQNPEAVDDKISSEFYAYLWKNKISSPIRLVNWEEGTKSLTYKETYESSLYKVKLGFDGFYKPQ